MRTAKASTTEALLLLLLLELLLLLLLLQLLLRWLFLLAASRAEASLRTAEASASAKALLAWRRTAAAHLAGHAVIIRVELLLLLAEADHFKERKALSME